MVARIWRGVVRREDAAEYAGYIAETGFEAYGTTEGNRGAWMLRRDGFAGDDIERAVYYPEDDIVRGPTGTG